MASLTGQSLVSIDDDERKTIKLYSEMNERFKVIKDKMAVIEDNFKQLAELSSETDALITPMMIALKNSCEAR